MQKDTITIKGVTYELTPVEPPRVPVCELPNENGVMVPLYEGGEYWYVMEGNYQSMDVSEYEYSFKTRPDIHRFSTEQAAQQHLDKMKRKPVVTLAGIPMYEGDKFWWVNDIHYEYGESVITKDHAGGRHGLWFPSLALAEAYVLNHKPAIPWGELNDTYNTFLGLQDIRKLLEKYKPVNK